MMIEIFVLMTFTDFLVNLLYILFIFLNSLEFFILSLLFLIFFHITLYFLRDRSYINAVRSHKDLETITINDLKQLPLVNILVPAGKEGKNFENFLKSIKNLSYPKIKTIVNAGGNDETIRIAESYKKYDNFIILRQEAGEDRAALGKIKALNDSLNYVDEGVLFLTDADCLIEDEILLRVLYPITNNGQKVVVGAGLRPLKHQENNSLVKYLQFTRLFQTKVKFSRHYRKGIIGANTCITYEVIKSIGKFSENRFIAEDTSRGIDILSKGFKIYSLIDYRSRIYTEFPTTLKELILQRRRYIENSFILHYQNKHKVAFLKIILLFIVSIYLVIFPLFLLFNFGLFYIGMLLFFYICLKRFRIYLMFKKMVKKEFVPKISFIFCIKAVFIIYLEFLTNFIVPFHLIKYFKYLKKLKGSHSD